MVSESEKWERKYQSYQERCNKWQSGLVEVKAKVKRVVSEKSELKRELWTVREELGEKDMELQHVIESYKSPDLNDLDASIFSLSRSAKEIESIKARNRSLECELQNQKEGAEDRLSQLADENRYLVVCLQQNNRLYSQTPTTSMRAS